MGVKSWNDVWRIVDCCLTNRDNPDKISTCFILVASITLAAFFTERIMSEKVNTSDKESNPEVENVSADVVNLSQSGAGTIRAELVRLRQGGAEKIIATEVDVRQGGAGQIEAQQVTLTQGGVGVVKTASMDIREGGVGVLRSEQATIVNGGAAVVVADAVDVKDVCAGVVITRNMRGENIRTGVLLTGQVEGNVETILDTPRAMLAGLTAGAAIGLVLWIGYLLTGRKD
jgi:hypothetical protein